MSRLAKFSSLTSAAKRGARPSFLIRSHETCGAFRGAKCHEQFSFEPTLATGVFRGQPRPRLYDCVVEALRTRHYSGRARRPRSTVSTAHFLTVLVRLTAMLYQKIGCNRGDLLYTLYGREAKMEISAEKEHSMMKFLQVVFLSVAVAGVAVADDLVQAVPEIDAGAAVGAVGLLAGGLLVMRGRRKR